MPGRALMGTVMLAAGMLTVVGALAACGSADEPWDLPLSPMTRPNDIPLDHTNICGALKADPISIGCRAMAEAGTAEIVVIPQLEGSLRQQYSPVVNGDTIRWIGISRFPAIQLATGGGDGLATCRIALDVAPNEVLLVVYRQEAADPKLPPCRPARDYASKAIAALQNRKP